MMFMLGQSWHTEGTTTLEETMPEALSDAKIVSLEELTGIPSFERLNAESALQPCDGHASAGVNAIVSMLLPNGGIVVLCGSCARKAGYEHTATAPREDRAKGSDH
jgi:hypothetical protein